MASCQRERYLLGSFFRLSIKDTIETINLCLIINITQITNILIIQFKCETWLLLSLDLRLVKMSAAYISDQNHFLWKTWVYYDEYTSNLESILCIYISAVWTVRMYKVIALYENNYNFYLRFPAHILHLFNHLIVLIVWLVVFVIIFVIQILLYISSYLAFMKFNVPYI